eukprot:2203071-Pyramimonas_sp.AAC.1
MGIDTVNHSETTRIKRNQSEPMGTIKNPTGAIGININQWGSIRNNTNNIPNPSPNPNRKQRPTVQR